jgi:hypothetical protein
MRAIPREVDDAHVGDDEHAYALGLWCADGYWWSSSIGLSNIDPELILRFGKFLYSKLPRERICLRVYLVSESKPDSRILEQTDRVSIRPSFKMKHTAYHLYVNSRPLLRAFRSARELLSELPDQYVGPYLAGRFDGDGCLGITPRIAYTTRREAEIDLELLAQAGINEASIFHYRKASEFCIYIHKANWRRFRELLEPHSIKVERHFTL